MNVPNCKLYFLSGYTYRTYTFIFFQRKHFYEPIDCILCDGTFMQLSATALTCLH